MQYFKATTQQEFIGVASEYDCVKFNGKRLVSCVPTYAQYILIGDGVYHDRWMLAVRGEDVSYCEAKVEEITKEEFDALTKMLEDGAEIPPVSETPEEPQPPEETPVDPDVTIEFVKEIKKKAMSAACEDTILSGFYATLTDGTTYRFGFSIEDQSNLTALLLQVAMGLTSCDYYSYDGKCLTLSAEDMIAISTAATVKKSYHRAYYHCIEAWIDGLDIIEDIAAIEYGAVIPMEYRTEYLVKYATACGVTDYAVPT